MGESITIEKRLRTIRALRDLAWYLIDNEKLARTSTEAGALLASIAIEKAKGIMEGKSD